jgi:photosystem II stability/assembly factor-like uncharacterized protein
MFGALALMLIAGTVLQSGNGAQAADTWTRIGALPAGASQMASDGANTSVLYAYSNGIHRSTDGGATWSPCNREARAMFVITPLPGAGGPSRLYATTSGGLRTTDDGCKTWRDVPTSEVAPSGARIRWLTPYPNNQSVLYAGIDGLGGLYRSTDAGASWHPASRGLPARSWVTALVADPAVPANVLIGVRYMGRDHPPSYVYRSTDGGVTWRSSARGMYVTPNSEGGIAGLAWSGGNLLAATNNDGLYLSTDRGVSWARSTTPQGRAAPQAGENPLPTTLRIDSLQGSWEGALLLNTSEGAFSSLDGGNTWRAFGPEAAVGRTSLLTLDTNSGQALLATGGSLYSYRIASDVTLVPSATPQPVDTATPTPPLPPQVPTSTPPPPTPTATASPTALPPSPTVPVVGGRRPTDRAEPLDPSVADYFEQTGHNVAHGFRDFWKARGDVTQFGYPITEEFSENGVVVQYFQRARFEYRDGNVVLGRVGTELTQGQFFRPVPFFPSEDDNVYFGATGHSVSGPFLEFWRERGQEELLGYPVSESFKEDGSEYQWFERVRFEWHPYLPEGNRIVLGNVGVELLQKRGWLP